MPAIQMLLLLGGMPKTSSVRQKNSPFQPKAPYTTLRNVLVKEIRCSNCLIIKGKETTKDSYPSGTSRKKGGCQHCKRQNISSHMEIDCKSWCNVLTCDRPQCVRHFNCPT
ncbi:hypothetical protein BJ741DRAFT_623277 [Chytriomyces cf. hyalinus JEL632]|nr:hypothetical protein BJ741DRAFT_623277 [Chytriomyces cf. hyalinus JEL632]